MKINLNNVPRALIRFNSIFVSNGYELRAVGGCVRDLVMGNTPKDWDCCTNATPSQVMEILEYNGFRPYDLSNGHGTISVNVDGDVFEITTLRIDVKTDGRHAEVEFVNDFRADAERRDFTINAMSMALSNGWVYDYFGGLKDVEKKILRFVGDPSKRIQEDYLRILRFYRFASRFRFDMGAADAVACKKLKLGLSVVSGERIWMEMKQIFALNDQFVLGCMEDSGVLQQVMYQNAR